MAKETNVFVKVGRAEKHCIGTVTSDAQGDALQAAKSAELAASGVASSRVEFSRETVAASVPAASKKGVK